MGIIMKPIVTEKMTIIGEKLNRYAFVVNKEANKIEIKNAVEKLYGVDVEAVNTINYSGKSKSKFTKRGYVSGRTNAIKKAIVTISSGQTIDFYSNI
ncbi:MAG: 50S ribosomal protein L23 [Bacteroidales bacterium]|jgi:large subunit ribosomal protein L23|nr:50S ribosomal protein L23 [Bacteroidales bacterium]MDD2204978.1 50S ribosomal protein L23 [Bacteroidales bacterium]MDD3153220.1 50S ribosomal protein L23 [Bacteroidales bacterium]MDD3913920.1 50S ribosomal protein L23 [Bacteroidales bacterium]MDD4634241.1 50S ribosomal protein L23 [Bacteroidales bacterium]